MTKPWHERIAEARTRGWFNEEDITLASQWPTCACGEQDPRIPRGRDGVPMDEALWTLGIQFWASVETSSFDHVEDLLKKIDARAEAFLWALLSRGEE